MAVLNDDGEVRAAGGVIVRKGRKGHEVLLVHRPRYDDWTLPKGKVERGETDEACALREVEEETGFRCELGEELLSTRWVDRFGRPKIARYWRMRIVGGEFQPHAEVDEILWVDVKEAANVLSYARDAAVVAAAIEMMIESRP